MGNKVSDLVPKLEGQLLNLETFDTHSSYEHKWELWEGVAFGPDGIERDRLAICLLFNMGLRHFLNLLPEESKEILKDLLEAGK